MNLYDLGHVPWLESQLLYHALPRLGLEGLLLLAPAEPYVCIGYHQDVTQEVDLAYCREHGIPVFRREVGGGAVYLDGQQLFYQVVLSHGHPLARLEKGAFYQTLLAPVVATYRELGVEARYKPVNDIVTAEGRKISGNGVAEIAGSLVLVGNLIADFDYETMVRVLRVPDEKFRDKVFTTMRQNLTTLRRETGRVPTWEEMAGPLARHFAGVLGLLQLAELPAAVWEKARQLTPEFISEEWLFKRGQRAVGRELRIAAGVEVIQRAYKAPGGLIRVMAEVREGRIADLSLSGDFFFYPANKLDELEKALLGRRLDEVELAIAIFYAQEGVEAPGVTPAHFAAALAG